MQRNTCQNAIGPYPIQLVVVTAVNAAVNAAITMRSAISMILVFSFISRFV